MRDAPSLCVKKEVGNFDTPPLNFYIYKQKNNIGMTHSKNSPLIITK